MHNYKLLGRKTIVVNWELEGVDKQDVMKIQTECDINNVKSVSK